MKSSEWYTIGDAANHCGVRPWQVRRRFENGKLPPAPRVGAYRVIAKADLPLVKKALEEAGYIKATANGDSTSAAAMTAVEAQPATTPARPADPEPKTILRAGW